MFEAWARFDPVDPRVRLAIAQWPPNAPRGAVSTIRRRALEEGQAAALERATRHCVKIRQGHVSAASVQVSDPIWASTVGNADDIAELRALIHERMKQLAAR